jgi:hypothetical protein
MPRIKNRKGDQRRATAEKAVQQSQSHKTQYCPRYNNEELPCYHPCCYDFTKGIDDSVEVLCNQTGVHIVLDRYFTTTDGVKVDRLNLPKAIARGSKIPAIQALRNQWHSKKKNLVKIEGI